LITAMDKIGEYTIVRKLGSGGMSEVFEVVRDRTRTRHALKLYSYGKDDADVRRRFEAEGRILLQLAHPRIVRVTDIGEDAASGKPYFVMDLILDSSDKAVSLADIPEGGADESQIGKWYDDIREGLEYIHGKGIIHRDLKAQNIMIGPDGHAVITDFGISKIIDPGKADTFIPDPVQTIIRIKEGRNLVMGSIGYMAPELEMGVPATEKSDIYALGVIIYKLLTGTWCDSRTDVAGVLSTYDPVWLKIIPKLLHSNPNGRECLSYAAEKAAACEAAEAASENKYLAEKARGRFARHLARWLGAALALFAIFAAWGVKTHLDRESEWRAKVKSFGMRPRTPLFDDLFGIPPAARGEEQVDDDGNIVMYSRSQFAAARVDALILTHRIFSGMATGGTTIERAIEEMEALASSLEEDSDASPFDNLSFGGQPYMQFGEDGPLKMMLAIAVDKLRAEAEK